MQIKKITMISIGRKNNDEVEYGSGVFNGEFGTIIKINESEKQIKIKFDDEKGSMVPIYRLGPNRTCIRYNST